ncbi:TadE/TadG family type IV pilus assembly protein [Aurantiacibacter rhizosphaerae]|uniref:TadE-like domain-containing protein n=1 Tax=Aurantiacibacter rhizosphaerae TaxID=2691582 RepID=A0A844XGS4_9SPHN|nr:TadE family protein [Aurantiacibacter rhizosphaerae]MWV28939.1 hypothetical protein [Aurantiacibacter rhizosphaerae]
MMAVLRNLLGDTRAAAAAEMALILPMAFVLIFTTMEGGYYFQTEHKAIKYVREGARYAARQNFSNYDCSGGGALATGSANMQSAVQQVTVYGRPLGANETPPRARIADWQTSDVNIIVTCDAGYGTGLYAGTPDVKAPVVLVSTRFDYTPILGMLGFDIRNIDVVAQAEASVAGI